MSRDYLGGDCQDPPDEECWWQDVEIACPACGDGGGGLDEDASDLPYFVVFPCCNPCCQVVNFRVDRLTAADRRADAGDAEYHSRANGDRDA